MALGAPKAPKLVEGVGPRLVRVYARAARTAQVHEIHFRSSHQLFLAISWTPCLRNQSTNAAGLLNAGGTALLWMNPSLTDKPPQASRTPCRTRYAPSRHSPTGTQRSNRPD